jgi:alpha-tubulin suppressor-like RCC1 family protein
MRCKAGMLGGRMKAGALFSWGINQFGEVGNGTTTNVPSPELLGSETWSLVSARNSYSMAIRSDGYLFTWGLNGSNQLGDGTNVQRTSPVQIGSDKWKALATSGWGVSHAIREDGKLFAWGYSLEGSVGDGATTPRPSPVQIGIDSWTAVSGNRHVLAIREDGKLFAWGRNNYGQIGNGQTGSGGSLSVLSPTQIGNDTWLSVAAGFEHSAAIRSDGALFTWGQNNFLQLGDGTQVSKSVPTEVTGNTWTSVSSFTRYTLAIDTNDNLYQWGYLVGATPQFVAGNVLMADAGDDNAVHIDKQGRLLQWNPTLINEDGTRPAGFYPSQTSGASYESASTSGDHFLAIATIKL